MSASACGRGSLFEPPSWTAMAVFLVLHPADLGESHRQGAYPSRQPRPPGGRRAPTPSQDNACGVEPQSLLLMLRGSVPKRTHLQGGRESKRACHARRIEEPPTACPFYPWNATYPDANKHLSS